jgi:NADPH:quinone reductase-like Zn-dependent oxidoreductase
VKVLAISVNAADWHSMRGKPLFSRATLGLLRPEHQILGVDIAGQVEAAGSGVTRFKPGDEVYANLLYHGYGGFAEYVSVPVDVMSLKPANLSFEEAAAVPMAAVTDLRRALAEGGKAAVTRFTSAAMLMRVSLRGGAGPGGRWWWGRRKDIAMVSARVATEDLELLSELIEAGKVRPQIDRRYPFAEIPAAIAYLEQGRAKGKVVVGVA